MTAEDREPEAAWSAGAVARHLQIAESTLRSWHRRYGVEPHGAPGRYRRYTRGDVARLRRMRDLIATGMLPSEAARAITQTRGANGSVDVGTLVHAAQDLDTARCVALVADAISANGVVMAWDTLCRPALIAVDAAQAANPACVDGEHVLSWAVLAALHRVVGPPPTASTRPVLLACVPGEHHTLPVEALAAALIEVGVPVRVLGAATPSASIAHALQHSRPGSVVLWSQCRETADREAVRAAGSSTAPLLLAGPGWSHLRLAHLGPSTRSPRRVADLQEALMAATPPPMTSMDHRRLSPREAARAATEARVRGRDVM
ncbi:MerR family transcriptional regulator [Kutzneria buriramensis]|uniref:MerR-like DNA binding protein n=1 Tax=Kutzneria buriramensis TaxID=1045776 RepID=A0A3E0HI10_9PSEU|nr:MerR family transcriptional regulator [Kutzneria buriramensis]REH46129.1 MerR-like DNA binding protein [Kutzneria buriramensis]